MNESTTQAPKELGELIGIYDTPYALNNGCLSIERVTKSGVYYTRLCNFAPKIVSEVTVDDGAELTRKYLIGGKDDSGRELPLVEVAATELEKMEWMLNHWDASLDLDVVPQVQRHVRRAIKSTAIYATKKSVFAHTGWKKIDGKYFFLLPGNEEYDVELKGSLQSYRAATTVNEEDLAYLSGFLYSDFIPHEVSFPCLSLVFLTPLNEFLRRVGHEPKFILLLLGRTGSMKSTVAALFLSFFGNFSNTDLPMSFRDTANSIIHLSFALKDVLTCIDDYHPTGRKESDAMKATMQALARGYGDKAARNRLTADIQLRETRPPQGNAIVTAEFAPDIGESGTARLFCVEMKPGELDLPSLTMIQEQAHGGMLMRCMFAYTEWLRKVYLADSDSEEKYRAALKGDSWKFQCINDIEQAMTMVGSKEEFIALMESAGYTVKWLDSRKYITYTCPNGMKVRDNKLHESKFLKEYMQYEFAIRQQQSGTDQLGMGQAESRIEVGASNKGHTSKGDDGVPDTEGAMGSVPRVYAGGDDVSAGAVRGAFQDGDARSDAPNDVYELRQPSRVDGGMDENARQGYEELGGHDQPPSAISSHGEQGNLVTGWEEARRIFEETQRRGGRENINDDEAHLGYEVVDHRDDVLVGSSLGARIRDHLSADDLNSFFEGDENMRDDLPFDDEDDELIKSFRDLQYQARNGNVYAMYRLSRIYFGENSKYYHEAWGDHFLERSAEGGYHVAQYRIGKMLYYGIRYDQDIENAAEWLYRSAVGGNLYGATLLGKIYVEDSLFGAYRNDGFRMLFQAEQDGNEFAAYTLGKYYMEGKVVKKDIAKAIEHLEKASARGNMFADYRLAQIYLFEADIFDMEKAIEYLNRSAQAGNESAAVALTRMAQNTFLTITTDILNIVGNLSNIESYRQPQDCTTIPQHRPRKERKKDREWEHTL